jgi:DNA-binding response OmpR family regulator
MMGLSLQQAGFDVFLATTAAEALSAFRSQMFDLAILDEMMPGCKGHELALYLKGYEPSLPIILASAFPAKPFPGVDYTLMKPVAGETLRRLIGSIISGQAEAA